MDFINWLKKILGCKEEELKVEITSLKDRVEVLKKMLEGDEFEHPKVLGTISNTELRALLSPYCDDVQLSDRVYGLTSVEEAKEYSETTKVAIRKWISEKYDCDEFSFALMGYWNLDLFQFSFGIAWSNFHAFNIFVDNNKNIFVVEPQTNKFIPIEKAKTNGLYYPFRFIII